MKVQGEGERLLYADDLQAGTCFRMGDDLYIRLLTSCGKDPVAARLSDGQVTYTRSHPVTPVDAEVHIK